MDHSDSGSLSLGAGTWCSHDDCDVANADCIGNQATVHCRFDIDVGLWILRIVCCYRIVYTTEVVWRARGNVPETYGGYGRK